MFLRGFEADEPRTSGFFKLKKIRTDKNIAFYFNFHYAKDLSQNYHCADCLLLAQLI